MNEASRPSQSPATEKAAVGVWSPALTPFDDDLNPDATRFLSHARWLLDNGCHGLAVFGTTSEATSLTAQERKQLLEVLLADGVDPARLMVGTGCCAFPDSVDLTRHALANGCNKVLMLPPFYYKGVSDQGLIDSYSRIIEQVGDANLRIFFYHFPALSGVPITAGVIETLAAAYPGIIAGLKDSGGDADHTADLIGRFPDLAIFPGAETNLHAMLELGGAGCITASANVNASAIRALWESWQAQDGEAEQRQEHVRAIRKTIETEAMVPALKAVAAHYRDDDAWARVRPPLVSLAPDAATGLVAKLANNGFEFPDGADR